MEKIKVYLDTKTEWRWRFIAANGQILADSGEGYSKKADCLSAIDYLKSKLAAAPVEDPGDGP